MSVGDCCGHLRWCGAAGLCSLSSPIRWTGPRAWSGARPASGPWPGVAPTSERWKCKNAFNTFCYNVLQHTTYDVMCRNANKRSIFMNSGMCSHIPVQRNSSSTNVWNVDIAVTLPGSRSGIGAWTGSGRPGARWFGGARAGRRRRSASTTGAAPWATATCAEESHTTIVLVKLTILTLNNSN